MSFNTETAQKGNIFNQISDWKTNRAAQLSNADVNRLRKIRNDKTNADEAMIAVSVLLYIATAFCAYCAFLTYQDTFTNFPPLVAVVFAGALATAVELAKVFLTGRFLRSIFFQWMFENWWALAQWSFIGLLALGSFVWSIQISTEGLKMFAQNHSEASEPRPTLTEHLAAATAAIDKQIEAQQGTQSESMKNKWKGTVVWEAQKTATGAGKNIAALQSQRASIVADATAEWHANDGKRDAKISGWAVWVNRYGGYMELVTFLCLLTIGFSERKLTLLNLPPTGSDTRNGSDAGYRGGQSASSAPVISRSTSSNLFKQEADDRTLFKQGGDLFKHVIEGGRVVGLLYLPQGGYWRNLGESQVKAELNTYINRAANSDSETIKEKLKMWRWAAEQFDGREAEAA